MEEKKKVYSFWVSIRIIETLRKISKKQGIKISWLVDEALKDYIVKKRW